MSQPIRIALTTILSTLLLVPFAAAQQIDYHFDPPEATYITTRSIETTNELDGNRQMQFGFNVVAHNTLKPKSAGGYVLSVEPDSVVVLNAGQPIKNHVLGLLKGTPYELVINERGEAQEVKGFTDIVARVDSAFSGAMADRIKQRLDEAQLRNEITQEWNGLVGFRRQGAAEVGEFVFDMRNESDPAGSSQSIYSASVIRDTVRIGGRLCARMVITAGTDPVEVGDSVGLSKETVMGAFALTDRILSEAQAAISRKLSIASLTYEIETGLLRELSTTMVVRRTITRGGATGTAVLTERETVGYEYLSRNDS